MSLPQSSLWKEAGQHDNVSEVSTNQVHRLMIGEGGLIKIIARRPGTYIHERVIIFTTEKLMARFSLSKKGSFSTGTLSCDKYSQVVMLGLSLGRKLLPVAYGLIPQKDNISCGMFFNEIDQYLHERGIKNCVDKMIYDDEALMEEMKTRWPMVKVRRCGSNFENRQKMLICDSLKMNVLDLLIQNLCGTLRGLDELLERMTTVEGDVGIDADELRVETTYVVNKESSLVFKDKFTKLIGPNEEDVKANTSDEISSTTTNVREKSSLVITDEFIKNISAVKNSVQDTTTQENNVIEGSSKEVRSDECDKEESAEEDYGKLDTSDHNLNLIKSEGFEDCGSCKHCLDMRKFGGSGRMKQRCQLKPKTPGRMKQRGQLKPGRRTRKYNL